MLKDHTGLYTDMYELTMAQAYFHNGQQGTRACFDYFFRKIPFGGGFVVFAGLADLLEALESLKFDDEDLRYLGSLGFRPPFLDHLRDFRFRGDIRAVREGEIVFPVEPLLRVEGGLVEAQLVETLVLNFLNFQSLVASKAARVRLAAGDRVLSEFGFRRAHGLGGVHASRAAIIGGFDSTSNVFAAHRYGLTAAGTMAHSFVQSYDDELTAFRRFAEAQPKQCILLVDTYDTLRSGVPNAIVVAREMEARGERLAGLRLDSGDLAYMSKKARAMLDAAGLGYVRVAVSNQLDERVIKSLIEQEAPIDIFGVGTRLATGDPDGALDCVYKLSESGGLPRLKISETLTKVTLPGVKRPVRFSNGEGYFAADAVVLDDEETADRMFHPFEREKSLSLAGFRKEELFVKAMEKGVRVRDAESESLPAIAAYARRRLERLPAEHKRFEYPHIYKVGLSEKLMRLRDELARRYREKEPES